MIPAGAGLAAALSTIAAAPGVMGVLVAQGTTVGPDEPATWISGGMVGASVSAVVYIVRKFARGELVAREPAKVEAQLVEANSQLVTLVKDASRREDVLLQILVNHQIIPGPVRGRDDEG